VKRLRTTCFITNVTTFRIVAYNAGINGALYWLTVLRMFLVDADNASCKPDRSCIFMN